MANTFFISTFITGWSLPDSETHAKEWLNDWQGQHSRDHENIYSALNALESAIGRSPYKVNMADLGFNPKEIESINNFMTFNRFQHSEFYGWLNQLGKALTDYGKQPIVVYPNMNITGPILDNDLDMWATFLGLERTTHMLTLSAINQLYGAYLG